MPISAQVRYQIFVSSTYIDLMEERQAVISALLELDAFPAGMELFPAADDDAWTLIKSVIDDSDYYLLVIGGRYGSVDPTDNLSYTEKEYDYAVSSGKPVMAFLHGKPDSIILGKSETDDAGRAALKLFREKVQSAKHVRYWESPDDLAGKVARSFVKFVRTYPAIGWIRADQKTSQEAISEINSLRNRIIELEGEIEVSRTSPPPGTTNLAQGDDEAFFEIPVSASVELKDGQTFTVRRAVEVEPSWDDLLRAIGPRLLQDCEERELKRELDRWLLKSVWYIEGVSAQLLEAFEDDVDTTGSKLSQKRMQFSSDDFGLILVQLKALGLIQHSARKRSVTDTGTYWALTPYGETRTVQLMAITKENQDDEDASPDEAAEDINP